MVVSFFGGGEKVVPIAIGSGLRVKTGYGLSTVVELVETTDANLIFAKRSVSLRLAKTGFQPN
jgi:hypothetical protein